MLYIGELYISTGAVLDISTGAVVDISTGAVFFISTGARSCLYLASRSRHSVARVAFGTNVCLLASRTHQRPGHKSRGAIVIGRRRRL